MFQNHRRLQSTSRLRPRRNSRHWTAATLFVLAGIACIGSSTHAYNKVWVESKKTGLGETGVTVNVWVVNDVPLTGFVLPLEIRDTDGNGSYITGSCTFNAPAGKRIGLSPLTGSVTKRILGQPTNETRCGVRLQYPYGDLPLCSGPISSTYTTNAPVDFLSPDGFFWAGVSTSAEPDLYYLPAGSDSVAGTFEDWPMQGESTPYPAGGSFNFVFSVNSTPGTFEVDTMCVCPAGNLVGTDLAVNLVPFGFAKGVVKIGGDPPVFAFIPAQTVKVGQTLSFTVSATDPDGTIPSLTAPNLPQHATFTDHQDGHGTFSFTPTADQVGVFDITFAASDGIWLTDTVVVVSVDAASSVQTLHTGESVPSSYEFGQSYPNPFNASAVIRFGLPVDRHVRLDVFDVLGRRVRTLLNEDRPAGSYAVEWNGTDDRGSALSTGIYFYRIQTSDYVHVRSMVLLK